MNLSSPFIKRPVMTTLIMLAIIFFGCMAFTLLPVSDLPSVDYPTITVTAINPGANPQTMAANVARPLEQGFMTISGVKSVISTSTSGSTTISITFNLDKDIDEAATDVQASIQEAAGYLPSTMPIPPYWEKYNPSDSPVMFIGLSSETMDESEMYTWGSTIISQQLSVLTGVSNVDTYGESRKIIAKINPDMISSMNIGIDAVGTAITNATQLLPSGQVFDNNNYLTFQPLGQLEEGSKYENIILAYKNNAPLYLRDVGHVVDGTDPAQQLYLNYWKQKIGSRPTIVVAVRKQPGYNTVLLCKTIRELMPQLQKQIPSSASLNIIYDTSERITRSIGDVEMTLLFAFILVVLVIFCFIGKVSATFIPAITLPVTIIGTCILMYFFHYSVDILSTMGITLVIGFLVDDAIVVLENIVRHLEMGKTPMQAALDGSKQISTTVLSMTLSLAAVFIPMVFMPGLMGKMFHEFAMVVIISVLISGFVSLTMTPTLCSRILQPNDKKSPLERFSRGLFLRCLNIYEPMLKWCLKYIYVPIGIVAVGLVIAVLLFTALPQDFLPPGDTGVIQGYTLAAEGIAPDAMARYQNQVTEIFEKNPNMDSIMSVTNTSIGDNTGFLFATLKDPSDREPIEKVMNELYAQFANLIGIQCFIRPYPEINLDIGTSVQRAEYTLSLSTVTESDELNGYVDQMVQQLQQFPELTAVSSNVQDKNPQLNINILRDQASAYGISVKTIEQALNLGYGGSQLTTISTPVDTYWIIMEMEDRYRRDINALDKLYLTSTSTNQLVPLRSVATWDLGIGPLSVQHTNQFTSANIFFNIKPNTALGPVLDKINHTAAQILPEGIMRQFQGAAEVFQDTGKKLITLVIMGIICIYLLLGILYESFLHPLTILSALPGAAIGALLTLIIFNQSLSIYAYVGMIVLMGIVMKNGIMLVEFANEQIELGKSAYEAIKEACSERFRPILMTTIAAGVGAVPIALGIGANSSRRSLGLVIIGGLIVSQLITFFFTPILYLLFEDLQEWIRKKRKKSNLPIHQ